MPKISGEERFPAKDFPARILPTVVANLVHLCLSVLTEDELQVLSDTAYVINFQITEPIV